jgi:hypothetical protein
VKSNRLATDRPLPGPPSSDEDSFRLSLFGREGIDPFRALTLLLTSSSGAGPWVVHFGSFEG